MEQRKLGRPTDQRTALLRNQVSHLLWYGRIETTFARAKEVSRLAEKILTKAIDTYKDTEKKVVSRKNAKGQEVKVELINDGPKKLAARRRIIAQVYNIPEQKMQNESKAQYNGRTENIKNPLLERIFTELAPRYDQRIAEVGQRGGYTRVLKLGFRRGDNAEMAIIELV